MEDKIEKKIVVEGLNKKIIKKWLKNEPNQPRFTYQNHDLDNKIKINEIKKKWLSPIKKILNLKKIKKN